MKTFLVVNPQSANGQTGRRWPELSAQVARALGEFSHGFTQGPLDAARLAGQAIKEGFDCVVSVGGDGTLNEVVNGFFEGGSAIRPNVALGVITRGTGGDFGKTFGWDRSLDAALARIKAEATRDLDVGLVEFTATSGELATRYFANICSFGASGQVDHEVNKGSKALGGTVSFLLGTVRALVKYSDRTVRLSVDGAPMEELKVTTLAVANGQFFGSGMRVAPDADPCDGLFDVTVWTGYGLADFVLKSKSVYNGRHTRWSGTRQLRCRSIRAESDEEVLLDVDGEQPGRLPCQMTVVPRAIRLKG